MALVIHGVSKPNINFSLSNYSLTTQIVIINFFTAFFAFIFILIINFFLLTNNKNLENHTKKINEQLNEITDYLSQNAIKRILTFDDNCVRILREDADNSNCNPNDSMNRVYTTRPQLDPTYTQKYIYKNFLNLNLIVKVFADNWIKFADTEDFYVLEEEIVILDIDSKLMQEKDKYVNFFQKYKIKYFNLYNSLIQYLDERQLKKLKNDNITIMETIKTKKSISYIYKDQDQNFMSRTTSPILKDNKVFGVVLIIAPLSTADYESASQSFLLTNFFIFFISVMFFLSFLFSKSIVTPIKLLSHITNLERDKSYNKNTKITYPVRKDEIGALSYDIKSMSNDLKRRINEIEEFATDVSHELKNPLSGLKSSIDLLYSNKIEERNKYLLIKNMSEDIDRMNILISDISNYTLTQVEISEEILEIVEINSFFQEFNKSLSNKKVHLEIKNSQDIINLKINKNMFIQVLHNLLDNSLSYIKDNSKVLISITTNNSKCIIHFVDQGPGISFEYRNKIFERFYTDREEKKKSHTGIGLSISKNIIQSFGGEIRLIKNTYLDFKGACFEIVLPLKG